MEKDRLNEFRQIILAAPDLPKSLKENVVSIRSFEERILDRSYLSFLEEQIALEPRGPEWTRVLQKRLEALKDYCGKNLLSGIISEGDKNYFITISAESKKILYWELWDLEKYGSTHEPFN